MLGSVLSADRKQSQSKAGMSDEHKVDGDYVMGSVVGILLEFCVGSLPEMGNLVLEVQA
jgi:hypothetical protein